MIGLQRLLILCATRPPGSGRHQPVGLQELARQRKSAS